MDRALRPDGVTEIVSHRGNFVMDAKDVTKDWEEQMIRWWLWLQPAQRGEVRGIEDLASPHDNMEWGSLHEARGYKGAYLLCLCMMHWIRFGRTLQGWKALAEDMTAVFKVLLQLRKTDDHASTTDAQPKAAAVAGQKRPAEDDNEEGARRGSRVRASRRERTG